MTGRPIPIDRLVEWALVNEAAGAGASVEGFLYATGSNAGTCAGFLERGGVLIDGGNAAWISGARSDVDALDVWAAIHDLEPEARGLVMRHGRSCTRPDPVADASPRLVASVDVDRGRPRLSPAWDRNRNRLPQYCYLSAEWTAEEINDRRRIYSAWWRGLDRLRGILVAHGLRRWEPIRPAAPEQPADPWFVEPVEVRFEIPAEAYPDRAPGRKAMAEAHRSTRPAGARQYAVERNI